MALPETVPSLSESDFDQILKEMEEYDMAEEQRRRVAKHEAAIEEDSD